MNISSLLTTCALLSSALLFSSMAAANDQTTFPGSICDASSGSNASKILKSVAGTQNASTTAGVGVTCGLSRENALSASGTFGAKAFVYRSSSATVQLSCTLASRTNTGGLVASQTLFFNSVGEGTLNFNALSNVVGGYYVLSCNLPQYSVVRGVYLDEI